MRRGALLLVLGLVGLSLTTVAHAEVPAYEPHSLLIGFRHGIDPAVRAQAHANVGATVKNTFDWLDVDVVRLPASLDPVDGAERYRRQPGVAYADLNYVARADSVPNDTYFGDLWGLDNTGQITYGYNGDVVVGNGVADVNAPEGWDLAFGPGNFPSTGGTRVGILDTGIDQGHPDLQGLVKACAHALSGYGIVTTGGCDDDNNHGTHVAGTIAARANNGKGVAGVAPNAELAICKILGSNGSGYVADLVGGSQWLRNSAGAKVISMSLGHSGTDSSESNEMQAAYNAGVVMVAAAGNRGNSQVEYPAGYASVISVASIDAKDRHSSFSQYNSDVELAAPGEDILSTVPGGYDSFYGTSMATPHVSGVAAMVISELGFTASETRARLQESAVDLGSNGRDQYFGYGRVNLEGALAGVELSPPSILTPTEGQYLANTSVTISGEVRRNATVTVVEGATTVGTTTADDSGNWSMSATFTEGSHTITATATLGSQESAPSAPRTFTIDTVAPLAPVIDSPAEGALLNSRSVSFAGTGEADATITLIESGNTIGTATTDGSGNWSTTLTLSEASHAVVASATDRAGNVSPLTAVRSFSVDAPPLPPVITYPTQGAHIGGPNIPIVGTGQASASIVVKEGTSTIGSTTVQSNGSWSVTITFVDGNHTIAVTQSDAGGVSLPATLSFASGTGPLTPVILTPAPGSYNKPTVTITGTAELQTTIKVFEGTTQRGQGVTRSDGKWTVNATFGVDGSHTIMVFAYDLSNAPSPPAFLTFTTDGTAPVAAFSGAATQVRAGIVITLDGTADDNIGVTRVEIKVVRPVGGNELDEDAECPCAPDIKHVDWTISALILPGVYNAYVYAYDAAGNQSKAGKITLVVV